jgi:tetratricopeptide (TPR) repeat protein
MKNSFEIPSAERTSSQAVFGEWCKMFGLDDEEMSKDVKPAEKIAMYDSAFKLGAEKFLAGFLLQMEDNRFDISALKAELDFLRTQGDSVALGKREQEIAKMFQEAISAYTYERTTNHPTDILAKREMNCVGASLIGGMLLEKVGIQCVLARGGSHSFLLIVTSDNKVWWQDMQDGKEISELNNQELTTEKITGINEGNTSVSPSDIVAYVRNPTENSMTFGVNLEHWGKSNPITIDSFLSGIERQELVNTGFQLTNSGKHKESLEILEIAIQKSPNVADAYLGLAKALRGLGRYEEAITKCKKALELDPVYSYAQDEIDKITVQLNQPEE